MRIHLEKSDYAKSVAEIEMEIILILNRNNVICPRCHTFDHGGWSIIIRDELLASEDILQSKGYWLVWCRCFHVFRYSPQANLTLRISGGKICTNL